MSERQAKRRPGRPVEARATQAALDSALDLIAERGLHGVTTNAVAERARTSKATMYRRWPTKDALIADAIGTLVNRQIEIPDTGSLAGDLRELLRAAVELYSTPRAAALMPELVAGVARDPGLAGAVRSGFLPARRRALEEVLRRAAERGELRDDVDHDLCLDLLGGVVFYRLLVTGGPLDDRLADDLTAVLLRAIARPSS
ncbi:MAG TPA: TetR/AcrR family transcriptional regulator [Solirubrobacter sp.]|nr:TetR/AcrR family transcriptional regulator [Solirubrobacter sp.]